MPKTYFNLIWHPIKSRHGLIMLKQKFKVRNVISRCPMYETGCVIYASPVKIVSRNFCALTGSAVMLCWKERGWRKVRIMLDSSSRVALRYKQIDANGPNGSQVRCVGDLRQAPCSLGDWGENVLATPPPSPPTSSARLHRPSSSITVSLFIFFLLYSFSIFFTYCKRKRR